MNPAIQPLIEKFKRLPPEQVARLGVRQVAAMEWTLRDALCAEPVASFNKGPLLWLTRYTATENEQAEQQGLPFRAPFPKKSYFIPIFKEFLAKHDRLFICKSRTLMTSWGMLAYATWCAQWRN